MTATTREPVREAVQLARVSPPRRRWRRQDPHNNVIPTCPDGAALYVIPMLLDFLFAQ